MTERSYQLIQPAAGNSQRCITLEYAFEIFLAFPHKHGSRPQSGHFREDCEMWFQCVPPLRLQYWAWLFSQRWQAERKICILLRSDVCTKLVSVVDTIDPLTLWMGSWTISLLQLVTLTL